MTLSLRRSLQKLPFLTIGKSARSLRAPEVRPAAASQAAPSGVSAENSFTIPNPEKFLARARAEGLNNVVFNEGIGCNYNQTGDGLRPIVNPDGKADVFLTWYDFAACANDAAGKGILAGNLGLSLLVELGHAVGGPFVRTDPAELAKAQELIRQLESKGHRREFALLLGVVKALNPQAFASPRIALLMELRFFRLLWKAPGGTPLQKLESVFRSMDGMFSQGNQDIFADMGPAGAEFLRLHAARPDLTPEEVLGHLRPRGGDPIRAKAVYEDCIGHLDDPEVPNDFSTLAPTAQESVDLVTAGFALYVAAGETEALPRRNAMIATANNLMLFREQRDIAALTFLQPATDVEVAHEALMRAITPTVRTTFGSQVDWTFITCLAPPRRRLRFSMRLPIARKNWAVFADRWDPITRSALPLVYAKSDLVRAERSVRDDPRTAAEKGLVE